MEPLAPDLVIVVKQFLGKGFFNPYKQFLITLDPPLDNYDL